MKALPIKLDTFVYYNVKTPSHEKNSSDSFWTLYSIGL